MWNILEQPWTLLAAAAIAFLVLAVLKNSLPDKYRFLAWLIPLLIAAGGFGLDYLVDTDSEQIKKIIKTAVVAVENEQPEDIAALISDNYRDSLHRNKKELMAKCRFYLRSPFVDNIIYSIRNFQIKDDSADILLLNRVFFEQGSEYIQYAQVITAEFKIHLTKNPNKQWLIDRVELFSINASPAEWQGANYENW